MDYIKKHSKIFLTVLLLIICFVIYFINLGEYPLIDTYETKIASISRDMINANDWAVLKLNGQNYYEFPPLLFWVINLSYITLGKISTFAARIPSALIATAGIILLFQIVSKILTKSYALIISLITAVSFSFLITARLATQDIIYTVTTMAAILIAYLIIISNSQESKLKYWIFVYIFIALSILSCGLFGLLPLIAIMTMCIFSGKLKEFFYIKNIIAGIIILILIDMPWFCIMLEKSGTEFVKNFFGIYDISQYMNIKNHLKVINYFILGFLPWSFSFLWIIGTKAKDIINSIISYFKENSQEKLKEKWKKLSKVDKFLSLNTILFFTTLIFAIIYGSGFTFLITFLTIPAACISGYYWYEYMFRKEHDKSIFFATIIPNLLFMLISISILFGYNFIKTLTLYGFNYLIIPLVTIFFIIPLIGIFAVILKGRIPAFISNLILMISLSCLASGIFNFITINNGEADLIKFAVKAAQDKAKLASYLDTKPYSLIYYYEAPVEFHNNNEINWLRSYLSGNDKDYLIVEIKDLTSIENNDIKYLLIESGKRYCLIKHLPKHVEEKIKEEEEPELIII